MPSTSTTIAGLALVVAVGGGTAYAATTALAPGSVGTRELASNAVTNSKIAAGAVSGSKLAAGAVTGSKIADGAISKQKLSGAALSAVTGTVPVTTLTGTWVDHSDGKDGKSTMGAGGVVLGGTADNGGLASSDDYAGISTNALNGLTPADLSTISYTESYTMPEDSHYAAPYFKLKLKPAGGVCGDTDVVYNPSVQSANLDYSGQTQTFQVTAPYSTVGVNNDANPDDGPYPVALHSVKNGATRDVSGDQICLAEIILGGGSAAQSAKATIYDVTVAGAGLPVRTYRFGTSS